MAMVPKKFNAVRSGDTRTDNRTMELVKEVTEFIQQYVIKDDKFQSLDWQAIEDELGLEHGLIYRLYVESEGHSNCHTSLLMGILFGMWAMDTRYHHLETKPLSTEA